MTEADADRALRFEIDEGVFLALRARADRALEAGDEELARGYRWLADHRREPRPFRVGYLWWHREDWRLVSSTDPDDLPVAALGGPEGYSFVDRYRTRSEAYDDVARPLGQWLRDHAEGKEG